MNSRRQARIQHKKTEHHFRIDRVIEMPIKAPSARRALHMMHMRACLARVLCLGQHANTKHAVRSSILLLAEAHAVRQRMCDMPNRSCVAVRDSVA